MSFHYIAHSVNRYPVRPPLRVVATQADTYICKGFKETEVMWWSEAKLQC